jgi:hypothetical protein
VLLFGKRFFCAAPRAVAWRLRALVGATPRPSLETAREWLVIAGQLEQAVCDEGGWPAAAEITAGAARLFLDVREGKTGAAALSQLHGCLSGSIRHLGDRDVAFRIPEGFAWYGLYPDSYAVTAERWAPLHRGRAVSVIGLLSIGTSLSAVVAEQLRRCGTQVMARLTLRPAGHPFRRTVAFAGGLPPGEALIIVDEGPGLSGSSMAGVAEALHALGAPKESIFFFPGHGGGPGHEAGAAQRRWWENKRCWHTPAQYLHPAAQPGTAHVFGGFAAVNANLETLASVKQERQQRLAAKGLALSCRGVAHGWIEIADTGTPLRQEHGDAEFISNRLAPYIANAAMPTGDAGSATTGLERIAAALLAWADEQRPGISPEAVRRMQESALEEGMPPLLHGDGRLMPGQWVRLPDGRVLKRHATGTDWEHGWPGPQSVLWDVAGAAVEWNLTDRSLGLLLDVLSRRFGICAGPSALRFHRAGYCCFRIAEARHRGNPGARRRYEAALKRMEGLW